MKKIPTLFLIFSKKVPAAVFVLLFLSCLPLFAKDFGLILDQNAGFGSAESGGAENANAFDYSGALLPRFSAPLGENGSVYASAGVTAEYKNEDWTIAPELLRTEFSWRFGGGEFTVGRMSYSDPLGFVAAGLFDGAEISLDSGGGAFSAGAWYTGLLYKKRANIAMTAEETQNNSVKLDYGDFFDTYFASERVLAALGWEHPGLRELFRLNLALLGQFDLSGAEEKLHSQYFAVKTSVPAGAFTFSLGGVFELMEQADELDFALAGELGASWNLPTAVQDQLSFRGIFTSGVNSSVTAFLPLTTVSQGEILEAKLSALSVLSLDYTARLHRTFSASVSSSYFVRSDLKRVMGFGDSGYFLGNEFFGRLFWSPVSDLRLNLGGGVFLPSLGDVEPDMGSAWRIELNAVFALY